VAGLLGTIAFAWAAGSSSGLISMIENGTYTMMSATGWKRDGGHGFVLKWDIHVEIFIGNNDDEPVELGHIFA
jgi:hypothetical protein